MGKILCIIDGMTDPEFSSGDYPNLSSMRHVGAVDTVMGGEAESLNCILHLLGIRQIPRNLRGYAEALGCGIAVCPDDLILRGSWFAVDAQGRCTIPTDSPAKLTGQSDKYQYHSMGQYKCLLVFPGMASSLKDIQTQSPYNCSGRLASDFAPKGLPALEELFARCLGQGRCLIPWGQSVPANLPPLPVCSAAICGATIARGIAGLLGMTLITVPGATGDTDTDLMAKTKAALSAAEMYPFVLLHINGADEAAHRKDRREKMTFLRKVDEVVLATLIHSAHELVVVSDHGTDPKNGLHIGNMQPVFMKENG